MSKSPFQPNWVSSTKTTRFKQLKHLFDKKNVLDIGCAVGYKKEDWMHKHIKSVSNSLMGMDIDQSSIGEIRKMGYPIEFGNAQDFTLTRTFDVIHAGELIEHLDSPGDFLESVSKHLKPDGVLVLTTPNALRISNFIYAATGGLHVNSEHTCWFCEYTLTTLLNRKGFEVVELGYLKHETFSLFRKMILKLRSMILPDKVAWNTVYVVARLA